jgi:pimeloyl-ACP methyl ester carboxylesterase
VAQARPDKVKALIAVEPAGSGDPQQAAKLKDIPTLFVYGDFIEKDTRWPTIRKNGLAFGEAIVKAGGKIDVIELPKAGFKGNSHMLMMDKNNLEVAKLIQDWLAANGLYR